jgi:DNA-binding NarL/FixJ family response regulator
MARLKVLLVDGHQLMLVAMRAALAGEPDIEVVGAVRSLAEAAGVVVQARPTIVLLGSSLGAGRSVEVGAGFVRAGVEILELSLSEGGGGEVRSLLPATAGRVFRARIHDADDLAPALRRATLVETAAGLPDRGD